MGLADRLIRSCRGVQLLGTSRELLGGGRGEVTWRVASLSAVDPKTLAGSATELGNEVIASESSRLFVDRARLRAVIRDNAVICQSVVDSVHQN